MGTMTGWQALADEVKICQVYAAYNVHATPSRNMQTWAPHDCMSAFHAQNFLFSALWVYAVLCVQSVVHVLQ